MLAAILVAAQLAASPAVPQVEENYKPTGPEKTASESDLINIPLMTSGVLRRADRVRNVPTEVSIEYTRAAQDKLRSLVISTHAWCVSGLPYVRKIDVLFPERSTIDFLGAIPRQPVHVRIVIPMWTKTSVWQCNDLVLEISQGKVVDVAREPEEDAHRCGR